VTLAIFWHWTFLALSWLLALGWCWQVADWLMHFSEVADLNRLRKTLNIGSPGAIYKPYGNRACLQ
jgi:hypothetical protein